MRILTMLCYCCDNGCLVKVLKRVTMRVQLCLYVLSRITQSKDVTLNQSYSSDWRLQGISVLVGYVKESREHSARNKGSAEVCMTESGLFREPLFRFIIAGP